MPMLGKHVIFLLFRSQLVRVLYVIMDAFFVCKYVIL